jgi:hypothetical protein
MKANIYGLKVNDMKQKKKIDLSLTEPFLMLTDKSDWGANTTNEIRTCFVYIPIKDGNLTFLGTREEDIDFGKYDHHAVKGMFKFSENILVYGETDTIVENTIKYDVQPSETQRKVEKLIERLSKTGEFNYVSSSDEDCLFRLLKVADVRVHKS